MPKPTSTENENEFVKRCIPIVLSEGTAADGSQAAAICHSIWDQHNKKSATMKDKKIKSFYDLELKALEKTGEVAFYFASWSVDQDNDIFLKTAYNKTFAENKKNIYHNRDHREAVGMPKSFGVDEKGAFAVSQLAMKTIAGMDTFAQYEAGLIKGHSQEFQTIVDEFDSAKMVRTIKEVKLWGITSVTNIPANLDTPTISMKSYEDIADQMAKVNKLLTDGKISDQLGERLVQEYKSLSVIMDKKIKEMEEKSKPKSLITSSLVEKISSFKW